MATRISTGSTWTERESLRAQIESARQQIAVSSLDLKRALNPVRRVKNFAHERPWTLALATVAAGAVVARALPLFLWRHKGSLLGRFSGQLARSAAGLALPILAEKFLRRKTSAFPAASPAGPPFLLTSPNSTIHTHTS